MLYLTLLGLNSGCRVWLVANTQCLEGTQSKGDTSSPYSDLRPLRVNRE